MRLPALLCVVIALPAFAGEVSDPGAPWPGNVGAPRALAMGNAHAAVATGNDAIVVNPAGLAQLRKYHMEISGTLQRAFPAQGVLVTVADSVSTPVASGMMFHRFAAGTPEGRGEGWVGGASYAYNAGGWLFGGTTKYIRVNSNAPGVDEPIRRWVQDFGILTKRGSFSTAIVVHNVALGQKIPLFPLTTTAAVAWGSDASWHFAFDYRTDLSETTKIKHRTSAGLEVLIDQSIALRGGADWHITLQRAFATAGLAFLTPAGGVQFVYRRGVKGGTDHLFEAGITLYLE